MENVERQQNSNKFGAIEVFHKTESPDNEIFKTHRKLKPVQMYICMEFYLHIN